jgi:hypothetical protein
MSINECESCKRNCCVNFKLTQELTAPQKNEEVLNKYPFIHRTNREIVLFHGNEKVVGVYNCDRFDIETKKCINYDSEKRPEFCENTGIMSTPNSECILKNKASD